MERRISADSLRVTGKSARLHRLQPLFRALSLELCAGLVYGCLVY